MPARRPHEAGLQLAGDPPSFEAYAQKPESEWHFAQDEWLAQFFEGKRTLPVPQNWQRREQGACKGMEGGDQEAREGEAHVARHGLRR